ncbi:MAG: cytochrome c [Limibacillus sp.]
MKRLAILAVLVGLLALGGLLYATAPQTATLTVDAGSGDPELGRTLFLAGGCQGCHAPPRSAEGRDPALPSGGHRLPSPVGTFFAPNITPDPDTGIGKWRLQDFVTAMVEGASPDGRHYYPAFPYGSYRHMTQEDLAHLFAYLKSLKPVSAEAVAHDVPASGLLRPFIGLWKAMALGEPGFQPPAGLSGPALRGAYLVQGPGHCGECHTPRNLFMVPDDSRRYQGGPHPEGKGQVPSIVGLIERGEYKDAASLKEAFEYGEMFGYDSMSSGGMGEVQGNLSKLPSEELDAIVAYLVSLKP